MFLNREPDAARWEALRQRQGDEYRFALHDRVLYYTYPKAIAGHRRTIDFERILGVVGTARDWKVVAKLIELTARPARA